MRACCRGHHVRGEARIAERIALLKTGVPVTGDGGVIVPALLATRTLVAELRVGLASIERYDEAIVKVVKAHPDAASFSRLPGAGPTFVPRLLAALGRDRSRYLDAASAQQYRGIAPLTAHSGNSTWVHWRLACSSCLRQSIVEGAGLSVRDTVWAEAFYRQQRDKGKGHHVAIRALAFKWLRILYRCWHDREPYDDAAYLFALRKRNSSLLTYIAELPTGIN